MKDTKDKDTYILTGVGSRLDDLLEQKRNGYNPGVKVLIKDANSQEVIHAKLNLTDICEIKERPGAYRFIGFVSEGFRISNYFYAEESEVEGYVSTSERDICPIRIAIDRRQRGKRLPASRLVDGKKIKFDRELYKKWKHQTANIVPQV